MGQPGPSTSIWFETYLTASLRRALLFLHFLCFSHFCSYPCRSLFLSSACARPRIVRANVGSALAPIKHLPGAPREERRARGSGGSGARYASPRVFQFLMARQPTDCGLVASGSDEEHFSDASEGRLASVSRPASRAESPVPITRVEKVDDEPSYGEVPGSTAYEKRQQDAVPDEVEVLPEGQHSRRGSRVELEPDVVPSGNTVPRTLVEKVDPEAPSYGEVPGTEAYERRKADAAPDLVFRAAESGSRSNSIDASPQEQKTPPSPVPQTLLSRVDSIPTDGTTSAPHAHRRRPSDALPDATETVEDAPGKPNFS